MNAKTMAEARMSLEAIGYKEIDGRFTKPGVDHILVISRKGKKIVVEAVADDES